MTIRDFVAKLSELDDSISEESLFKTTRALDTDGSGTITLDEFLEYFGAVQDEPHNVEDNLEDEIWPEWVSKEGKIQHAQKLLLQMYQLLTQEHGVSAEEAFSILDLKETGSCTTNEFQRILKIFFGEVFTDQSDSDFLVKLAGPSNGRVDYRDFCKYLSKKTIRSFKNSNTGSDEKGANVPAGLDRPLTKEASLTYILRKAAELKLDLRKTFSELDKNDLTVIPRTKFVALLLDLPLGLSNVDVSEILENDLHFDNYGNVDYTVILNSDLYIYLERGRMNRHLNKKRKGVKVTTEDDEDNSEEEAEDVSKVDNRKVVVEDLIYIDDLEIMIYTTVAPQTSNIFITSTKKNEGSKKSSEKDDQVITLDSLATQGDKALF